MRIEIRTRPLKEGNAPSILTFMKKGNAGMNI